ncbi:MAG TPA: HAD family phosphatase, partial [Bryobacteraceae bacterium]|nr:HAD family phosphatase [Bryobacteraceae bacterium]
MIKTVIFDLGKVLIPFDFSRGYRGMEQFCDHPPEEIRRRLRSTDLVNRFETGLIEPRDFVEQLTRLIELRADYDQFCEIWSSIFLHEELVPEAVLEGIAARYRMLVLSNTNAIHYAMVRRQYPLLRHFDDFILSFEVKAMKPQPAIYQEAIARAQCHPEECFYTDDIPEYVEGARQQGIDAVQFESREQL